MPITNSIPIPIPISIHASIPIPISITFPIPISTPIITPLILQECSRAQLLYVVDVRFEAAEAFAAQCIPPAVPLHLKDANKALDDPQVPIIITISIAITISITISVAILPPLLSLPVPTPSYSPPPLQLVRFKPPLWHRLPTPTKQLYCNASMLVCVLC